ncbi:sister chromatid cohesion protein Dcc1 [Gongronella butleri]|nr:sister chromatid cohesion protein Dcc1 [Gongronella butleri]
MPSIRYSPSFTKGRYLLLQLDHDELVDELESGSKVTIKGLPDDEAVLCTRKSTYTLRQVNTSNSLLLCSKPASDDASFQVHDDLGCTIELLPSLGRTHRLELLLRNTKYAGPEQEDAVRARCSIGGDDTRLYTWDDLLSVVQASEHEVLAALDAMNAYLLDGYYRTTEHAYQHRLLDAMATTATIQGVDLMSASIDQLHECLDQDYPDVPRAVRHAFFKAFVKDMDAPLVALDIDKVTRFLGHTLLEAERGKEWPLQDFVSTWKQLTEIIIDTVPELSVLQGLYYTTQRQVKQEPQIYVTYLPRHELPSDPADRFARLFSEKAHWSPEDLFPFVDDMARDTKQRDAFLLKYTRTQKMGGKIVYGSRIK